MRITYSYNPWGNNLLTLNNQTGRSTFCLQKTWPCPVFFSSDLRPSWFQSYVDDHLPVQTFTSMSGKEFLRKKVYHVKSLTMTINCTKTRSQIYLPSYHCFPLCPHPSISAISWHCVLLKHSLYWMFWEREDESFQYGFQYCQGVKLSLSILTSLFCWWSSKLLTNVRWEHHHPIG